MSVFRVYTEHGLLTLLRQLDQQSRETLVKSKGLCTKCGQAPATLEGANPCYCAECAGDMVEEWRGRFQ